jgi:hypothetical protein
LRLVLASRDVSGFGLVATHDQFLFVPITLMCLGNSVSSSKRGRIGFLSWLRICFTVIQHECTRTHSASTHVQENSSPLTRQHSPSRLRAPSKPVTKFLFASRLSMCLEMGPPPSEQAPRLQHRIQNEVMEAVINGQPIAPLPT